MKSLFNGIFNDRKILVTGNSVFKGSWLTLWLSLLGAKVIGFSRYSEIRPRNFHLCELENDITQIQNDIRNFDAVKETIQTYKPSMVFHLAAQPLVKVSYLKPYETMNTNAGGTLNVLEAIRISDSVKYFIAITTDKVYKDQGFSRSYTETDQLGGHDPYSGSKAMAELAINSYRSSQSEKGFFKKPVDIASARAGNVIGGGDFADPRLLSATRKLVNGKGQQVVFQSKSIRPWQYVLDALSGYLLLAAKLAQQPGQFDQAWNFAPNEKNITCKEFVETFIELWGYEGKAPTWVDESEYHETKILNLDAVKAQECLGWQPTYTFKEMLSETVDWFKAYEKSPSTMKEISIQQIKKYVERARHLENL